MAWMTKLKEMIPWRRKAVSTHDVVSLRHDIDRVFDRFLASAFEDDWFWGRGSWPRLDRSWWRAWADWSGVDVEESEDDVAVRLEVPGVDPKDLDVTIRDGQLHLRFEWDEKQNGHDGNREFVARRYGAFSRTLPLPDGLETSSAKAVYKHGVLTVRIPRIAEARQTVQRVPVQA